MTVGELMERLSEYPEDAVIQMQWDTCSHTGGLADVQYKPDDKYWDCEGTHEGVVWLYNIWDHS